MKLLAILILLFFNAAFSKYEYGRYTANPGEQDVSIVKIQEDLYINKKIPNINVKTLQGDVSLYEFLGSKPAALLLVYFSCNSVCPISTEHLYKVSKSLPDDYRYIVLSFDEKDDIKSLENFILSNFGNKNLPQNWLVGILSKEDIKLITQSVGFKFFYVERDKLFLHPSVTIFISPEKRIMRYLYGAFLRERDVKMAFIDAQRENPSINNIIDLAILACFRYDHTRSRYTIDPLVIFASIGMLTLAGTLATAYIYNRNKELMR
ncbi:MAG: SCO family protein [Aquificaceae bacterium]|nr:SCO family protein [Aquificaceae bacterium]MDW8237705.1 SCO family protein [Aquificaceae bacterium]